MERSAQSRVKTWRANTKNRGAPIAKCVRRNFIVRCHHIKLTLLLIDRTRRSDRIASDLPPPNRRQPVTLAQVVDVSNRADAQLIDARPRPLSAAQLRPPPPITFSRLAILPP